MIAASENIFEVVLVSQDGDGVPHVAPFGIRHRAGQIHIAPYRPSKSLDNLLSTGKATINMTDDVRVIAGALTHHECWQLHQVAESWILDSALSYQQLKLNRVVEDEVRPSLYFDIVDSRTLKPFLGYNRAQNAVLELAIMVSRIKLIPLQKISQAMKTLQVAIDKTAGERERQAWQWLCDCIHEHEQMS